MNEDIDRSCDALWSNVFLPSYKSRLFSSVAVSEKNHAIAEVSEFATGMVLLAMDRKPSSASAGFVYFYMLVNYTQGLLLRLVSLPKQIWDHTTNGLR